MLSLEEQIRSAAKDYENEKEISILNDPACLKIFTDAFLLGRNSCKNYFENNSQNNTELGYNNNETLLSQMHFSTRTRNILLSKYYETAEQVSRLSEEDLGGLRDVGEKVIAEIKNALSSVGLRLSNRTERPLKDKLEEVKQENYIRKYSNVIKRLSAENIDSIKNMELTSIFSTNDIHFIIKNYGYNLKVKDLYNISLTEFYKSSSYEVTAAVLYKLGIDISKR